MAVTAVLPGLFPNALLSDTTSAAPTRQDAAPPRASDVVVFSSAPFRALAELAAAGLRQLATLLPTIEQAVEDRSIEPMIHLAKAAGAAARQVADGHVALLAAGPDRLAAALPGVVPLPASPPSAPTQTLRDLARQVGAMLEPAVEPRPSDGLRAAARQIGAAALERPIETDGSSNSEPAMLWLAEAKHLLHRTGAALDEAGTLVSIPDPASLQAAPNAIAVEIAAAQMQVAAAFASLSRLPTDLRRGTAPSLSPLRLVVGQLSGATSAIGAMVLLTVMSLASGLWWLCLSLIGLTATAIWVWRIGRAARGVTLDAAR